MNKIYINKLNRVFDLEICKVNKTPICTLSSKYVDSIYRSLNDIDKIELTIPKYIYDGNMKKMINPVWYEIKDERLISLNNYDYFVIKVNNFDSSTDEKSVTAYSREYKLGKNDIIVEDIAFMLLGKDEEKEIYSLNEYMKKETGWSFGHIDDSVRFDIVNGVKTEKVRIQTSINKRWLDYINNDISESYNCIVSFDTKNKLINLYDINTAENVLIYLSHDNYIKNLARTSSGEDIVTRLTLVGSEEMNIVGETATGYPYIEDYSYFKDNEEMSNELTFALDKYYEMVNIRTITWKELVEKKKNELNTSKRKRTELFAIYAEINSLKGVKEDFASIEDAVNEAITAAKITELIDKQVILETEIKAIEENIKNLEDNILDINILCNRETATDENGVLIFNESTLEELKEFVYCDTYTNDSFLEVKDLITAGERELSLKSKPTVDYEIDVKNFMNRIINHDFNIPWNGELGLGDIVILYDKDLDKEIFLFVTDYTQNPNAKNVEDGLSIVLSNKKYQNKDIRNIGDKVKEGSLAMRTIQRKIYLLNETKYNRLNLKNYEMDYMGGV